VSPTLSRADANPLSLANLYRPIAGDLQQVEEILRQELRSEHLYVDELVRYGCLLGGKRLRPALVLLCGQAVGTVRHEHLTLAAVIEMVHTASLVHDDVLDEAQTRRHLATVNSRWDAKTSVLLGDFLFTHAFYLASVLGSVWACRQIGRATNIVCEGELRQKGSRGDFTLSEPEYLEIIAAKTAELCACSCAVGAYFGGASELWVDRFTRYGRDLGIAFQIIDDVLDLAGDEQTVGKSLGTDLEQHKLTLPLIHLLDVATPADRRDVLAILERDGNHRQHALTPFFRRYEAFAYSYQVARDHTLRAACQLEGLPSGLAQQTLLALTDFVVSRTL
jgi:octaprenyl-diphosphate synthase